MWPFRKHYEQDRLKTQGRDLLVGMELSVDQQHTYLAKNIVKLVQDGNRVCLVWCGEKDIYFNGKQHKSNRLSCSIGDSLSVGTRRVQRTYMLADIQKKGVVFAYKLQIVPTNPVQKSMTERGTVLVEWSY